MARAGGTDHAPVGLDPAHREELEPILRHPDPTPHSIGTRAISRTAAPTIVATFVLLRVAAETWHFLLRRGAVLGRMPSSLARRGRAASGRLGTHAA